MHLVFNRCTTTYNCIVAPLHAKVNTYNKKTRPLSSE